MRGAMRPGRLWMILLAAPVVVLGADAIYWRIATRNLEDGFAAWVSARRAAGWTVQHQAPTRGGWPLAATLTVPGMMLSSAGEEPVSLRWSAERMVLRVVLMQPNQLEIAPQGQQRLGLPNGPDVSYSAE